MHKKKVGFFIDVDLAELLRDVAFYSRVSASQIVERLIKNHVSSPNFRKIPRRPKTHKKGDTPK